MGEMGFYKGETARLLAGFMREQGGLITEEDLALYEAEERPAVHGTFRGYDIYGMPPPSSGGVAVIEMLNILEGYDLKAIGHNSALYLHLLTEAMRRAFLDRATHIGDPNFNPDMPLERLLSKDYARSLREEIDLFLATPSDTAQVSLAYESPETTHLSVVDAEGNAVSLTYTLEYSYGSRIVVEGAGFLLNNEMGDFNPIPGRTTSTGLIGTPPQHSRPAETHALQYVAHYRGERRPTRARDWESRRTDHHQHDASGYPECGRTRHECGPGGGGRSYSSSVAA